MYPWSFGGAPEVSEIGVTRDGKDIESCPGSKEKILLGTQQCDFCVIFYQCLTFTSTDIMQVGTVLQTWQDVSRNTKVYLASVSTCYVFDKSTHSTGKRENFFFSVCTFHNANKSSRGRQSRSIFSRSKHQGQQLKFILLALFSQLTRRKRQSQQEIVEDF